MISSTQLIPTALDEAAAIVEAEWMRLMQQGAASGDDHYAEPNESPAPQVNPLRVALGVACVRRPGPPSVTGPGSQLIPREAQLDVRATGRSPPELALPAIRESTGGDTREKFPHRKPTVREDLWSLIRTSLPRRTRASDSGTGLLALYFSVGEAPAHIALKAPGPFREG
jgi:hypothetical protein